MTTKERVLGLLEQNRGKEISGEALASSLGVSRNAVWKAIKELRKEGVEISAKPKAGYFLADDDNSLSKEGVTALLGGIPIIADVRQTVTSTNDVLKALAAEGAPEGTAVIASQQTAGKGRLGRKFYSPPGSGVYISLLLRPKMSAEDSLFITTSAAVAVCHAIETVSGGTVRPKIKWVNDIYIGGKKVCGILTEASVSFESGQLDHAVLGIGINITTPDGDFPDDIKGKASSIFGSTHQKNIRNRLTAEVLKELYKQFGRHTGADYLDEYRQRSMLTGRDITVIKPDGERAAKALGIDDKARLIVLYDDGSTESLSSGEVSIQPC
ncbi:MAG: biotin--[Ruminococcus sp.]|nr:biotin--[acetyl-CoA-carboxylase] ligase [Ruminococcus sp.]